MAYIDRVSENTVAFQKRRVEFTHEKLRKENKPIHEWQIYKQAGLRPTVSNEVKRLL